MNYISTRGKSPAQGFGDTMLTGLAPDGGLYVPDSWPRLEFSQIAEITALPYEEAAVEIMRHFIGDSFSEESFRECVTAAYSGFDHKARCPIVQTDSNEFLLELFHGPTLAFKDVAMQLIGHLFDASLTERDERKTIIGATSGDTGSAAIEAFRGRKTVDVFIMYPHGRISEVQRRQMTTPDDDNVHALAVEGDFDDCQRLLKELFGDSGFRDRVRIGAVNSINWARVMAQVVYYFTAAVAVGAPERAVSFTVPTGNFGDVYAGYVARRLGLPVDRLIVATNQNDILHRTFETGIHEKHGVTPSMSPSMDIQVSSNFERVLFDSCGRDGDRVRGLMASLQQEGAFEVPEDALPMLRREFASGRASERETAATMRQIFEETGHLICPHTSVGMKVARDNRGESPMVVLATAHAAKFPEAAEEACGVRPALPDSMADIFTRPERTIRVSNDAEAVKSIIEERTAA
ncbi:MAG: threonine synthase [Rhodobacteraceae bacterium]|nr:threonine synthase [Paracoccaceae bacterium]MCY4139073.1 threonine synthase [Paracoccaceae bacterium]